MITLVPRQLLAKKQIDIDIAKATIVHPLKLIEYLITLVRPAHHSDSPGSTPLAALTGFDSENVEESLLTGMPLLGELLTEIGNTLKKDWEHPNSEDFTVREMLNKIKAFTTHSAEADFGPYTHWINLTNISLALLRGIESKKFRSAPQVEGENIIMHYNAPRSDSVLIRLDDVQELYGAHSTWKEFAKTHPTGQSDNSDHRAFDWASIKLVYKFRHRATGSAQLSRLYWELEDKFERGEFVQLRKSLQLHDPVLPTLSIVHQPWSHLTTRQNPKCERAIALSCELADLPRDIVEDVEGHRGNLFAEAGKSLSEMLSLSQCTTHAHAFVLQEGILYMMIADRSGVIISKGFNVVENFHLYLALLFVLQRFDQSQWGLFTPLDGETITISNREYVSTNRVVYRSRGIVGKHSTVQLYAYLEDGFKRRVAVKVYWPRRDRSPEEDYLKKIQETLDKNPRVHGHTPFLLDAHHWTVTNTLRIRVALGCDLSIPRHLAVLVMRECEGTIRDLRGQQYACVMLDCIKAHFALWEAGIRHGDISDENLLYRGLVEEEKQRFLKRFEPPGPAEYAIVDELRIGILADFDMATPTSHRYPERGTTQFMSARLLDLFCQTSGPPPHEYLDEIEAFMWVAVVDSATLPPEERDNGSLFPVRYFGWGRTTPDYQTGLEKSEWLRWRDFPPHVPTESHEKTWSMLWPLVNIVRSFRKKEKDGEKFEAKELYDEIVTTLHGKNK
ncbi:hypothetical protein BDN72DRAFT_966213 [Pluteus cervinus]|uniref:Uncharacterized protein n=1 Tax=Pluteus cervinus TaxID=181527 RepID=A0ACD2ZZZ3_9AGAR|nr:hypothetical protein BDN72DRAFT_966213 [Pluteus cervinus]